MKILIILLGLTLTVYQVKAQIITKESKDGKILWCNKLTLYPKLVCFHYDDDKKYHLYFQNENLLKTKLPFISLGNIESAKEFLRILMIVADEKERMVTIELENATWIITKNFSRVCMEGNYMSHFVTKKDIENMIDIINKQ